MLAVAAAFIGACFLPIPWAARAAACAAMAVAIACARPALAAAGIPDDAWTIAASMLMFRMIIFLYELKHAQAPESPLDAISYFFLLPNYCFLHFPVVDYRTMQRGLLRRRRPRDPAPRAGDDVPGDAPPPGLPPGLPSSC